MSDTTATFEKRSTTLTAGPRSRSAFARLVSETFREAPIPCAWQFPSGETLHVGPSGDPAFTVTFHTDRTIRTGFSELAIGRAYVNGEIDVEGDMRGFFEIRRYLKKSITAGFMLKMWLRMCLRNPVSLNRESIAQHYNFGDDFYLTFVDRKYHLYSHCLFRDEGEDLEEAAEHKFEVMSNALSLKPGMRLLDIGAGWGAVTRYAGPRGVHVTSLTIAEDSHRLHNELIAANGLEHCENRLEDFLVHTPDEPYDAIVIFGVIEHIPHYRRFVEQVWKCLKPGGRIYLDASAVEEKYLVSNFVRQYIYPGTHTYLYLPDLLQELVMHGFKVVETVDETHEYDLTLHHWAARFETHREIIVKRWGEKVFRAFRMYLWGGSHAMRERDLQAYHVLAERTESPGFRPGLFKRIRLFIRSLT